MSPQEAIAQLGKIIVAVACLAGLIPVAFALLRRAARSSNRRTWPYRKKAALCSAAEIAFFEALEEAISDHYRIFTKVRIADVLEVYGQNRKSFWHWFNQISAKHYDYVLCDRYNFAIVAAIELDDNSHSRMDRIRRDEFVDEASAHAGLQLFRVPARKSYSADELREKLLGEID